MTKESVLNELLEIENDKRFEKQGNLMFFEMLDRLKILIVTDRNGVIDAMRYWLSSKDLGSRETAENLSRFLLLKELRPELEQIRKEITTRKCHLLPIRHYLEPIDLALQAFDDDDAIL